MQLFNRNIFHESSTISESQTWPSSLKNIQPKKQKRFLRISQPPWTSLILFILQCSKNTLSEYLDHVSNARTRKKKSLFDSSYRQNTAVYSLTTPCSNVWPLVFQVLPHDELIETKKSHRHSHRKKVLPEIYLTRLLSTKVNRTLLSTLQHKVRTKSLSSGYLEPCKSIHIP